MRKLGAIFICMMFIIFPLTLPTDTYAFSDESSSLQIGPCINTIIYHHGDYDVSDRIDAIEAGEVDIDGDTINHDDLSSLPSDILVHQCQTDYLYYIDINCERYPLNISGFRRAFAYALNKTELCDELVDLLSDDFQAHDSVVPAISPFCIEDEFSYHYYDGNLSLANEILDQLNFSINPETGYRLTPAGNPLNITVYHSATYTGELTANHSVETFLSLNIASAPIILPYPYVNITSGLYDMWCYRSTIWTDVRELADEYWSENADSEDFNTCRFKNTTFDSWREQLLQGITYAEVYEASSEMQKILHHNVPRLIVCKTVRYQMYSNDSHVGFIPEISTISGEWTMRKVHPIGSETGGTLTIGVYYLQTQFNIFWSQYKRSGAPTDLLYSSLYDYGPNDELIPDLATDMICETHTDNPAVPVGHKRYTIDIVQNASWSDGQPLTGLDVAFTYNYEMLSGSYGNPAGNSFENLVLAYSPTPYRVVVEFDTESYWSLPDFAFNYIIPEHIFNDEYGIGYEDWNAWHPVINETHPHVTCGPFILTDYEYATLLEFTYNPLFHYIPEHPLQTTTTTTTTTITGQTSTTTQSSLTSTATPTTSDLTSHSDTPDLPLSYLLAISTSLFSGVVIIYCLVRIHQKRVQETST